MSKRENPFGLLTLEMRNEEIREEGLISDTCTHYDVSDSHRNGNLDTLGLLIPQAQAYETRLFCYKLECVGRFGHKTA